MCFNIINHNFTNYINNVHLPQSKVKYVLFNLVNYQKENVNDIRVSK